MAKIDELDFSETLADGQPRYRRLSSGAIFDNSVNHIVARNMTSEEGRYLVNKRWDKWREAAASAMLKEVRSIDPTIKTEQEAWAFLVAKQFVAFLDAEKPRGDDLIKFGQVIGATPNLLDVKQQPEQRNDDETEAIMRELLRELKKIMDFGQVIEGEVVINKLADKTS